MKKLLFLVAIITMMFAFTLTAHAAHGPNVADWYDMYGSWDVNITGFITHYLGEQTAPTKRLARTTSTYDGLTLDNYAYSYDENGNVICILELTYGSYETYEYDDQNRIIRNNIFSSSGELLSYTIYTYDNDGLLVRETAYNDNYPDGKGDITTTNSYENGLMVQSEHDSARWGLSYTYYNYDQYGNIKEEISSNNWCAVFEYDNMGRLIKGTTYRGGEVSDYAKITYDKDGYISKVAHSCGRTFNFIYEPIPVQ